MKCLKGPVPRVVATASGEAAADQEMAHLLLAQELSGISSRSEELGRYAPSFFARRNGPTRPDRVVLKPHCVLAFKKITPRGAPGGNVRGPAVLAPPSAGRRWAAGPPQVLPPT